MRMTKNDIVQHSEYPFDYRIGQRADTPCSMADSPSAACMPALYDKNHLIRAAVELHDVFTKEEMHTYSRVSKISEYDIILPTFVSPSSRISKRSLDATNHPLLQEVKFTAFGEDHHLKLELNRWLLKPGLEVEYLLANGTIRKEPMMIKNCHYFSTSLTHQQAKGALSTCDGMRGSISVGNEILHIEPLKDDQARRVRRSDSLASHPHVIYKRDASSEEPAKCPVEQRDVDGNSGGGGDTASGSETIYDGPYLGRKYIEIFYLADSLVYQEFGDETESYAMSVLNVMSRRFSDPSLDIDLRISVVRFMIATTNTSTATSQDGSTVSFTVTPDADRTLDDFCEWQAELSYDDDENQDDWDLAILFSGEDIHSSNQYNLLGLAYVGAVCSLHRKCQITENSGLSAGFVMSHESGHNLGLWHDGTYGCAESVNIMSATLSSGVESFQWSSCSSNHMKIFINTQTCMDDVPGSNLSSIVDLPGYTYDKDEQCQIATGDATAYSSSFFTDCSELWCTLPSSPLLADFYGTTAEGTSCGDRMWCIGGECVSSKLDVAPAVDGGWTEYSNFSECSRSCGTGVRVRIRNCTDPTPQWGGEPCVGDSHDYELCNQELHGVE
ncbi:A disintegrin and metalloproteinase with thrombospondin motifs 14-like [Diadema antillarum]|uniref:A disintegrin and metalloproteinase with thrombospondin motifs 14-like n=1 Tax=Diadema antillarum TaxID=105358 RepID=UPI003A885F7C